MSRLFRSDEPSDNVDVDDDNDDISECSDVLLVSHAEFDIPLMFSLKFVPNGTVPKLFNVDAGL